MKAISVSALCRACLDEAFRERLLRGEKPPTRHFTPPGEVPLYGRLFHRLAERFTEWLVAQGEGLGEDDSTALWGILYERLAERRLERICRAGKADSAWHLASALKAFCGRLAALLRERSPARGFRGLFLASEFPLAAIPVPAGARAVLLSGKIDAVRALSPGALEIVDYKLTRGERMKLDLLQLAIYARMLEAARPGRAYEGVLEYYEPKLEEVRVEAKDLQAIFSDVVAPVLALLGGEAAGRKRGAAPPDFSPPAPGPGDLSAAIRECFSRFGVKVEVIGRREAPQLVRYEVKPASGVRVSSIASRAEDLKVALSLPLVPVIEAGPGRVTIDIPRERPLPVPWREVIESPGLKGHPSPVAFAVGVGVEGRPLVCDLADPNTCHALVAGAAGAGKSELLKSIVATLAHRTAPDRVRLTLIDPKILTFTRLAALAHVDQPVVTEPAETLPRLEAAVEEMEERYRMLSREGFENLSDRFAAGRADIPFRVILFDEFGDLVLAGRNEKQSFERLVGRLAQKGRAAGVHLILATQRPDRHVVTGIIRANLPLKICLRVVSQVNAKIVLDRAGAERLLGRGDLLCDRGFGIERAQAPLVTADDLRAMSRT
ncbi:MAG: DNA translocase FtsK [Desulfobacterales bacterium]